MFSQGIKASSIIFNRYLHQFYIKLFYWIRNNHGAKGRVFGLTFHLEMSGNLDVCKDLPKFKVQTNICIFFPLISVGRWKSVVWSTCPAVTFFQSHHVSDISILQLPQLFQHRCERPADLHRQPAGSTTNTNGVDTTGSLFLNALLAAGSLLSDLFTLRLVVRFRGDEADKKWLGWRC